MKRGVDWGTLGRWDWTYRRGRSESQRSLGKKPEVENQRENSLHDIETQRYTGRAIRKVPASEVIAPGGGSGYLNIQATGNPRWLQAIVVLPPDVT